MEEVKKPYLKLDGGTVEEHLQEMKEFLGLRPDQSFQDIEDDDDIWKMKIKYIGEYYKVRLKKDTVYDVLAIENGWYKLTDELGEVGFYPPEEFNTVV